MIQLTVIAESAKSLRLGFTPVEGARGYAFYVDGNRVSNTWDATKSQVVFGKPDAGEHTYSVVALTKLDEGDLKWPAVVPTPPPPTSGIKGFYDANSGQQAADWAKMTALGFNLLITAADDTRGLAAVKASGGKAWVSCGTWTGSGFSTTDAQAVALAKAAVASGVVAGFYIADEPANSPQNQALVKARSNLLKQAVPGIETIVAYFDAPSLADWRGTVDAFALDIYPARANWNMALIPELAAAADAAGMKYYGVVGADGATNYPMPTPARLQTMIDLWKATKQSGWVLYAVGAPGHVENRTDLLAVLKANR